MYDFFGNQTVQNPNSTSPYPKIDDISDLTLNPHFKKSENNKSDKDQINNNYKKGQSEEFFEFFK